MPETIVTPTIRTPLLAAEGGSAGRSPVRTHVPTTKDWWLYWDAMTRGVNQAAAEIRAIEELIAASLRVGAHADRLAEEPDPIGALWMESDRGNVIYQAQFVADVPSWVYVTGTMYGTMSPDERPVDLAANDAGFRFEATDTAQTFRWSGSAWVETTSQGQTPWTSDIEAAGFDLTNTGLIRVQGGVNPTSGAGLELSYQGAVAYLVAFDRTAGSFREINLLGGNVGILANTGRFTISGLPTSAAGLTSGMVWRDPAAGNVLKMVP